VSKFYLVGSGIASLAAAAYMIRDGKVNGSDILIFEERTRITERRLLHERQSDV
jgi:oleate hydratase